MHPVIVLCVCLHTLAACVNVDHWLDLKTLANHFCAPRQGYIFPVLSPNPISLNDGVLWWVVGLGFADAVCFLAYHHGAC